MNLWLDTFTSTAAPELWFAALWPVALKGALLAALALLVARLLRHAAAGARYLVWAAAMVGALILPLLTVTLPAWRVQVLPASPAAERGGAAAFQTTDAPGNAASGAYRFTYETKAPALTEAAEGVAPSGIEPGGLLQAGRDSLAALSWTAWALLLWGAGVLYVMMRLLIALGCVWWLARHAEPVEDPEWLSLMKDLRWRLDLNRPVRLLRARLASVPMTMGVFQPVVVIPANADDWDENRRETVLLHELAHISRHDCLLHLAAQVACGLNWFNPLFWYAAEQMRRERERACDDAVLTCGYTPSDYATHLLEIARSLKSLEWSSAAAMAMARRSQLEGRLMAILDAGMRRRGPGRKALGVAALLLGCIVLPLAALRPLPVSSHEASGKLEAMDMEAPATISVRKGKNPVLSAEIAASEADRASVRMELDLSFETSGVKSLISDAIGTAFSAVLASVFPESDTLSVATLILLRQYGVDADFIEALQEAGYRDLSADDLITLAQAGVDADYLEELQAAGYQDLSVDELAEMSKFGVDPDFAQRMKAAGYPDLDFDELIELSKFGVDEDLVQEMAAAGYTNLRAHDLIELSKFGVDEDLIREMAAAGYRNLSIDALVELSKFGVDADLIADMRSLGYTNLNVSDLIELSKFGVDEDLVREMNAAGYKNLPISALIELSKFGVDEDLVQEMAQSGYKNLSVSDLIELSKFGVDADFVEEMHEAGLKNLTVDELIELRKSGVDADFIRSMRKP